MFTETPNVCRTIHKTVSGTANRKASCPATHSLPGTNTTACIHTVVVVGAHTLSFSSRTHPSDVVFARQRLLDLQLLFAAAPRGAGQLNGSRDQGARASGSRGRSRLVVERRHDGRSWRGPLGVPDRRTGCCRAQGTARALWGGRQRRWAVEPQSEHGGSATLLA